MDSVLTNEMFDLLNRSIVTQNYSVYHVTKHENDKVVPRSGCVEKPDCPPHGRTTLKKVINIYPVIDTSVKLAEASGHAQSCDCCVRL